MRIQRNRTHHPAAGPLGRIEVSREEKAGKGERAIEGAAERLASNRDSKLAKLMARDAAGVERTASAPPTAAQLESVAAQIGRVVDTGAELANQMKEIGETAGGYAKEIGETARGPVDSMYAHAAELAGEFKDTLRGAPPPDDGGEPGDGGGDGSGSGTDGSAGSGRDPADYPHLAKAAAYVAKKKAAAEATRDRVLEPVRETREEVAEKVGRIRSRVNGARNEAAHRVEDARDTVSSHVDAAEKAIADKVEAAAEIVADRAKKAGEKFAATPVGEKVVERATPVVERAAPVVEEAIDRAAPHAKKAASFVRRGAEEVQEAAESMLYEVFEIPRLIIQETVDMVRAPIDAARSAAYLAREVAEPVGDFLAEEGRWFAGWSLDTIDSARHLEELVRQAPAVGAELAGQTKEAVQTARKLEGQVKQLLAELASLTGDSSDANATASRGTLFLR